MASYATRKDVYAFGLPRGIMANGARLCHVDLAHDRFELDLHGFEQDDVVTFGRLEGGSLPVPVVSGTSYYVIKTNDDAFQISLTASGPAIALSGTAEGVRVAIGLPFERILEFYSRFVDAFLVGHKVPLEEPYPVTVTALVAELAAQKLLRLSGQTSETMDAVELAAKAQLERWAKGMVTRDLDAPTAANVAVVRNARYRSRGGIG